MDAVRTIMMEAREKENQIAALEKFHLTKETMGAASNARPTRGPSRRDSQVNERSSSSPHEEPASAAAVAAGAAADASFPHILRTKIREAGSNVTDGGGAMVHVRYDMTRYLLLFFFAVYDRMIMLS